MNGGAGFIGSNLIEAIVDKYGVTRLDNFHTGGMSNLDSVKRDNKAIKGLCNDCLGLPAGLI